MPADGRQGGTRLGVGAADATASVAGKTQVAEGETIDVQQRTPPGNRHLSARFAGSTRTVRVKHKGNHHFAY